MSLINEALKKAQRRQHEEQAMAAGAGSASGTVRARGKPTSAQTLLVIGAGAAALVVVSVVITVVLLNRETQPVSVAPAPKFAPAPVHQETLSPVIVAPVIPKPVAETTTIASSEPPSAASEPSIAPTQESLAPKQTAETTFGSIVNATEPAPAVSAAPVTIPPIAGPAISQQVQAFVDAVRVAGIRSSGADSRVLMNDRVYRVNDIVDRALGLKLVRVESDRLVFEDANGMSYEKTF